MNPLNTISIEQFNTIVNVLFGLICFLMGMTLLFFNIPASETVRTYRSSIKILSINYLVLSILVLSITLLGLRSTKYEVFPFPILIVSTSQGLILIYALVSLYASKQFARKHIINYNLVPLLGLIVIYIVFTCLYGDPVCNSLPLFFSQINHPTLFIRFVILLFNIYQIAFYSKLLIKLSARYTEHLDQFYSDTVQLKPQRARRNFYFSVLIGATSIIAMFIKSVTIDTIFTIVFCVYYFLFALMYMQYKDIFAKLEPEFLQDLAQNYMMTDANAEQQQIDEWNWNNMKSHILDQKLFLQSGITVSDMTNLFQTNRTSFSTLLNKNEGKNFNSFINRLRVEHAKQLLIEKLDCSIAEIAQQCGFTEQSNFTRQFKLHCNETPAVWAKNNKRFGSKQPEETINMN